MAQNQGGVPKPYIAGIRLLLNLSEVSEGKLWNAIVGARPTLRESTLVDQVEVDDIGRDDLGSLLGFLASAYEIKEELDASTEDIIELITESVREDEEFEGISEEEVERIAEKLNSFLKLENDAIKLSYKARLIYFDREKVFVNSKIYTDSRPVFQIEPQDKVAGFVITHDIKISYRTLESEHEIFLTLNSDDLSEMQKEIDNALKKQVSLGTYMHRRNADVID